MKKDNEMTQISKYEEQIEKKWKEEYLALKKVINENLPEGFELRLQYGMPTWVVPLEDYPEGYLNREDEPLPFISLGIQKRYLALYHLGILGDPELLSWFIKEYAKRVSTKLNMGKSCIRFTNSKNIPYDLVAELVSKVTPEDWIEQYESHQAEK